MTMAAWLQKRGVALLAAVAAVGVLIALPFTGLDSFYLRIVSFALINLIVVMGLVVLYGYSDQISLASAAFYGIGAYAMAYVTSVLGLSPFIGIAAALVICAAFGLLIALPALRLQSHYLAMGTMAFSLLASWSFAEAEPLTGGVDGTVSGLLFPAGTPPWAAYLFILLVALVLVAIVRNLTTGAPGLAMRALGANDPGARACGVSIEPIKVRAHIFAAVCAGLGGALYAGIVGYIGPSLFGPATSILFLGMAIIGGRNSLAGPIVATAALTFVQYLALIIPDLSDTARSLLQNLETDFYALALILLVLFAPKGLGALLKRRAAQQDEQQNGTSV